MASRKILVQLDIATASDLTSPLSGFVGFSAKADGLYQKIGTSPELRLLTSADVQNAILADGSITGAVSQAQTFTLGVKLSNLTQGYIPYASDATKLLSNSPIYTDGTNVGIGTTNPLSKLEVYGSGQIVANITDADSRADMLALNSSNSHYGSGGALLFGNVQSRDVNSLGFAAIKGFLVDGTTNTIGDMAFLTRSSVTATSLTERMRINSTGNVGIGTTNPSLAKLQVSGSIFATGVDNTFIALDDQGAPRFGMAKKSGYQGVFAHSNNANFVISMTNAATINPAGFTSLIQQFVIDTSGNVGIGTPAPNQQLEITQNFRLPSTAGTTPYGIIYKDNNHFIHDFNYGNNGTVTTGGGNTFIGINAGNFTMGSTATQVYHSSYNTGVGYQSLLFNTTGSGNTANGLQSLYSNTIGSQNTALGVSSLYSNTTGANNTALGFNSGRYIANGTTGRTTGNNGLYLGCNSKASADGTDNEIVIGYNAIGAGSNKTVIGNSSVTDTYFGSSTGSSKLWASALNLSGLTASKVVFTDGSKNLTSTGIGTASQFIKGDGSLDSNTYLTTGTTIISGSGVDGRITFWSGTNSLSSTSSLGWNDTTKNLGVTGGIVANSVSASISMSTNSLSTNSFRLIATTTAGYVLTADANGNGTWKAPGGSITGSGVSGRITFWNGTNSLSSTSDLEWNSTTKNLGVTGGVVANGISSISMSTNSLLTNTFRLIDTTTAGYVLTTDADGNGTWQAPTGGGSYTLPTATASVLGGVKIGSGITISSGVISVSTNYQAPITTGTTSQYFRGDLSLATFPTIISGTGATGYITLWDGTKSQTYDTNLIFDSVNDILFTHSIQLAYNFKLGSSTTAGYVLTTDVYGNGTWQAPTGGGGSYTLPTATASVLGGVKIGSGIAISSGVISVSTNYEAPLTFSSGLTRTGNTISFAGSSSYVPYTGATSNVNIGSYVMYANNFILNSDINLKCNIESIEIKNIDIDYKKYEFKSLVGDIRYGVIAQELLKVAPELVSSTPNNTFSVKYIDLLIHEIAYLKQEIKKLTGGN